MKKTMAFILILVVSLALTSCTAIVNPVLSSLGEYKESVYYTEVGTDYTDYGKYYYDKVDFTGNEYFEKIDATGEDKLKEHLGDFEAWVEYYREHDPKSDIARNYDFKRSLMDGEDYYYIESEFRTLDDGSTSFTKYDVYIYDIQTNVLYRFNHKT